MAYRTFVDRRNAYWQVWDVRPDRVERRSIERRSAPAAGWDQPNRRTNERRKLDQKRVVLDNGLGGGWLVFESRAEKKRLTPIPMDWEKANESQLRDLCDRAGRVSGNGNGHNNTSAA